MTTLRGSGPEFLTQFGEGFAGDGANAAHVNTVLGAKGGPVEIAWATSLATPTQGHARFVAVLRPNLPVKPPTLFIPKADVRGESHAKMTWGPAQAGLAGGVADALAEGVIDPARVDDLLLLAAVWVDWEAGDAERVYANNRAAVLAALRGGATGEPATAAVLEARGRPTNPFFSPGA